MDKLTPEQVTNPEIKVQCNYCGAVFGANNYHQCMYTNLPMLAKKVLEIEDKIKSLTADAEMRK